MKKATIALLLPLLCAFGANAQLGGNTGSGSGSGAPKEKTKVKTTAKDAKPFTVKWNPGSLAFGKIGLSGEYAIKRKKSVTFGVGIPINREFKRDMTEERIELTNKTFSLNAGYRMYLGKKSMRGLYFEPYAKYLNYKGSGLYTEKGVGGDIYAASLDHSAVGVGAQLGVQFMIANVVTFDFFFLGPEASFGKSNATFTQVSPGTWDSQKIEQDLRDLPLIGKDLEISVNSANRTVTAKRDGFVPGIRFGLSVGVHF